MRALSNSRRHDDPFTAALMPPPEETEEERAKRVQQQEEAARVSRQIDESLLETKKLIDKRKKATKVLLLGKLKPPNPHSRIHVFECSKGKPSPAKAQLSRVSAC